MLPPTVLHSSQLVLRKIIKIVATRCQILRLKCTKFDLGRHRWGSLQRSPDPVACKEREAKEGEERVREEK